MNRSLAFPNAQRPDTGGSVAAQVPALFLDRQRTVRRFTRAAAEHFELSDNAEGCALAEIGRLIEYPGLEADMEQVLASGEPMETEVCHRRRGRRLLVRLLPCPAD